MGKCDFQEDWLQKTDLNGYIIKGWAKKHNDSEAYCNLCAKSFSIINGLDKFNQHAKGIKHRELCTSVLAPNQLKFGVSSTSASTQASENVSDPVNHSKHYTFFNFCNISKYNFYGKKLINIYNGLLIIRTSVIQILLSVP